MLQELADEGCDVFETCLGLDFCDFHPFLLLKVLDEDGLTFGECEGRRFIRLIVRVKRDVSLAFRLESGGDGRFEDLSGGIKDNSQLSNAII